MAEIDPADLFWVDTGGLHRSGLDGSGARVLSFFPTTRVMAVHQDKLYFVAPNRATGTGMIGRTNLDGSSPETVANLDRNPTKDFLVDNTNVYWIDLNDKLEGRLMTTAR